LPRAASLATRIKNQFQIESELLSGDRGEFTVRYNGEIIAKKEGVFPDFEVVIQRIQQRIEPEKKNE